MTIVLLSVGSAIFFLTCLLYQIGSMPVYYFLAAKAVTKCLRKKDLLMLPFKGLKKTYSGYCKCEQLRMGKKKIKSWMYCYFFTCQFKKKSNFLAMFLQTFCGSGDGNDSTSYLFLGKNVFQVAPRAAEIHFLAR